MPAALGLVDLGVLLALAFLIALSYAYRYTLGAAIIGISRALGSIRIPTPIGSVRVFGFAADALKKIDDLVMHSLGVGIAAMQATWNEAVSYTATVFHWIGKEIADLAYDTTSAIEGLAVGQVKPYISKRLAGMLAVVAALKARVLVLERQTVALAEREARLAKAQAQAVEHAIAVPGVDAIPKAIPGIKWLDDAARSTRSQLKHLARYLTPAGIIGLVGATTFGAFGLGWLRCKGVGRVGRSLCGLSSVIEALYAGTLAAFAVTDLCRFAYGIERVAESIRPLMLEWVDVENALLGCSSASYPRDFTLPKSSPTPVVDAVAL